ncbi:MAG: hypothetical protein ASARMPREDX12_005089 [Alectoria sarmentosa]|nr:MAG: hypothetical protein ASARMPREDX12_005089 [Alectoria sarmentosa]CAD6589979.1 MAG: hypothetical protein ASARMPRED_004343 [Alectoria sarmentosa]
MQQAYTTPVPMVSHPQPPDRPLVHRPASVSSRSTNTRRHRNTRSHTGGVSYRPQNEFPNFAQTGDVEIIINADGQEKRYMLHRLILAQCSGFFETGTSEEWSKAQARGQSSGHGPSNSLGRISEDDMAGRSAFPGGGRLQWRYELDWGNREDEVPMLVQKQPQSTLFGGDASQPPPVPHKPPPPAYGFLRSMSNFSAMQSASHISKANPHTPDSDIVRDYDNLFRIFYNYAPALDAVNIAESYIQCKSLLTLADMYDALEVVGPRIDHHLLQFQGRLWKQIAKYPPSYLKLGYLARSKVIFAEALVHVVGQWPSGSSQLKHTVPPDVLEVIEDKVDELQERRMKTEARLFRLTLTTPKGERVTPANAYMDWLALSLFRQWLAESTTPPPPPIPKTPEAQQRTGYSQPPPLSSGNLFRLLGTGGSSYLARDEMKRFVKLRPDDHQRDTLKRFEKKMDEIKAMAREIVRPLMRNCLELDMGRDGGGLGYLTCTRIDEEDFPF